MPLIKYLAKGKRSFVFTTKYKNKKAIIKKARTNKETRINHEANILKLLNKHKIGPKLFYSKSNKVYMQFIKGKTIREFLETEKNKQKIKKIAVECLNQCYTLDKLKLNKEEMCNPYKHILLERKRGAAQHSEQARSKRKTKNKIILKPVFIDFEKSHFTEKPKNVTQFFQYLSSNKLVDFNEELKQLLKAYKNNPTEINYKKLKRVIK